MRTYKVVYCFIDKNGYVECDEYNIEKYYIDYVQCYNGGQAVETLKKQQKFVKEPEIVEIREVRECKNCLEK